jgi:hypothetical protein
VRVRNLILGSTAGVFATVRNVLNRSSRHAGPLPARLRALAGGSMQVAPKDAEPMRRARGNGSADDCRKPVRGAQCADSAIV